MSLTITITSDFICPWCYVAETRLKQALTQLKPDMEVEWSWHPFELNPAMPSAGIDRKTYRAKKFGSWEYSQLLDAKTIQATQNDDIGFRYDLIKITPNTLKAHRLTWFAAQQSRATAMAERVFKAYFTEGQDITDISVLTQIAVEVGLERDTIHSFLTSDTGVQEVRELAQKAIAEGIHEVPHIRIHEQVLSGAQPSEVYFTALQNALQAIAA
ncbi:MAG: DsbA family oxidoreductase [Leptolyngbya sp. SIO1D8]|nr:DsbA family oxidoreductase [Leptolyngbya sp. SIO1D8]